MPSLSLSLSFYWRGCSLVLYTGVPFKQWNPELDLNPEPKQNHWATWVSMGERPQQFLGFVFLPCPGLSWATDFQLKDQCHVVVRTLRSSGS